MICVDAMRWLEDSRLDATQDQVTDALKRYGMIAGNVHMESDEIITDENKG